MATAPMTSTDLVNSLITYLWDAFIPAYRARGYPYKHTLDVSNTVAKTGYAVKVTIGQVMASALLSDGGTRQLDDTPPTIATCTLNEDRYVAFGLTQLVEAYIENQATIPSLWNAALNGLLNDFEQDLVTQLVAAIPVANSVGTWGVALTQTNFIQAVNTLVTNYMPQENFYALLAPSPGAFGSFAQISTVTFAQERRNGSGFDEKSQAIEGPDKFDQNIVWNGGLWSNSQLIPQVTGSGSEIVTNVAWHPAALAVAVRPMPIPTMGSGAVARNMEADAKTGALPIQVLQQWNLNTQSEELVLKMLYGIAPAQSHWSCALRSN